MTMASRVLIVDDDPPTCELISEVLSSAELKACSLTNSTVAAHQLGRQKFDAVFLDARMPSPDGLELTRQMRKSGLNKKSLVIMITGDKEPQFLRRAFEAGVNFVLFKPVDRQALLRLLRVTQGAIDREKQRFVRVGLQRRVSMKYGQEHVHGTTVDMSSNGMLVKASEQIPVGTVVQILLELDREKPPLRGSARVVRLIGEDTMGLELETAGLEDGERLQKFLLPLILQVQEAGRTS
jgi:CheY-like chemotaxis protein